MQARTREREGPRFCRAFAYKSWVVVQFHSSHFMRIFRATKKIQQLCIILTPGQFRFFKLFSGSIILDVADTSAFFRTCITASYKLLYRKLKMSKNDLSGIARQLTLWRISLQCNFLLTQTLCMRDLLQGDALYSVYGFVFSCKISCTVKCNC